MANRIARVGAFVLEEARHALPPTIFFAIGFCFILATQKLILREDLLAAVSYLAAVMAALVVGKAVLVADKMPFLRRFDNAPLIQPILFKTFVYWGFVFIARLIEGWVHYMLHDDKVFGYIASTLEELNVHRFLFIQIWIFVLFLMYVSVTELSRLAGDGQLSRLLFRYAPSDLQLTRRQRMRVLTRLSTLAGRHSAEVIGNPRSAVHGEVIRLVQSLSASENPRGH